jgi:thymidylate synthase
MEPELLLTGELLVKEQKALLSQQISRHEEYQYLDLIREILETGERRPDRYIPLSYALIPDSRGTNTSSRTGTGTYSLFAPRPNSPSARPPGRRSSPS